MSDVLESWSLPWHTLQRSLAQSLGLETHGVASFRRSLSDARFEIVETATWRVRVCEAALSGS
ncbi:MAG TPA: hypothetical protein VME42_11270 [Steroidobacteraceae bacterium]|nr:hypothetical protein [Steroidobacteraceae bacterium]